MGYEIPAAIGVQAGRPGPRVWALVGDGTYLMMPTEIVTAVRRASRSRSLLVQNHGYASIGGLSESVGARAVRHRLPLPAGDGTYTGAPLPVDLAANAASLGMRVLRAKTVARTARGARRGARRRHAHMCLRRDRNGRHVSGPPPAQAWWDVPVAETATRPPRVKARELYERHVSSRTPPSVKENPGMTKIVNHWIGGKTVEARRVRTGRSPTPRPARHHEGRVRLGRRGRRGGRRRKDAYATWGTVLAGQAHARSSSRSAALLDANRTRSPS